VPFLHVNSGNSILYAVWNWMCYSSSPKYVSHPGRLCNLYRCEQKLVPTELTLCWRSRKPGRLVSSGRLHDLEYVFYFTLWLSFDKDFRFDKYESLTRMRRYAWTFRCKVSVIFFYFNQNWNGSTKLVKLPSVRFGDDPFRGSGVSWEWTYGLTEMNRFSAGLRTFLKRLIVQNTGIRNEIWIWVWRATNWLIYLE
jgi:hypothetical protein